MKKVYVAGKYNDTDIISALENMRLGMKVSAELMIKGYAPFCPWLDYQFILMRPDGQKITREMYQDYSMQWLEVSDCVLALPNWKRSGGAKAEIERAKELGIPVYLDMGELELGIPVYYDLEKL
jgi:hypothetical protein